MKTLNPRNNRLMRPKYIFIENANEALIRYEDFGSDFILNKHTGIHKVCRDKQFEKAFDRIKKGN